MEQLQPLPSHIENLLLPSTSHRKRARENDDIFNNGTGGNGPDVGDDDGVVAVSGSKNNQDGNSNGGDSEDGSARDASLVRVEGTKDGGTQAAEWKGVSHHRDCRPYRRPGPQGGRGRARR